MNYANYATHQARLQAQREANAQLLQERFWRETGARVGWESPSSLNERISKVDASSTSLDTNIRQNVADPAFKTAWSLWLRDFRGFRDKWLGWFSRAAEATITNSEVDQNLRNFEQDLEGWYAKYKLQINPQGQPVPPPSAPDPSQAPPNPGKPGKSGDGGPSLELPWYAWMLGGVAIVGLSYAGYRWYQKTQEATRRIAPIAMRMAAMDAMRDMGMGMSPQMVAHPPMVVV